MAITYPLDYADFWENIRFSGRPIFVPQHNRKQSVSGGGDVLSSFQAKQKWLVNVTVQGGWHDKNLSEEVDLTMLNSRDGTILAYDLRRPFPVDDPDGWKLDGRTITVASLGSNNRSLSLEGLRGQFIVTKGDKYSVLYDTDKRYLFEVAETTQADDTGETVEFEVWPFLPDNLNVGDVVTMQKGCGKFKLSGTGGIRPGEGPFNTTSGFSFSLISVP